MKEELLIWLRLDAPLQSWGGTACSFEFRGTGTLPTYSGVLGFLCACLGVSFRKDLDKVKELRDSIKMDMYTVQDGIRMIDFQAAGGWVTRDAKSTDPFQQYANKCLPKDDNNGGGKIYKKEYLQDAKFDVVLRIDQESVAARIVEALRNPRWMIFAGRKACHLSSVPFGGGFTSFAEVEVAWKASGRRHVGSALVHALPSDADVYAIKDYPLCIGDNSTTFRYVTQRPV